ncbi:MAG: endonuclease III [Candidatus Gracilibacteria bacterium]|nr:endonuclease III [Candidatus Gracilibacteria bacterium]
MNKSEKISFFIKNLEIMFPNAKCELDFETPFQLLRAVIMSAQTTDKQVNKISPNLFKEISLSSDVEKVGLEKIEKYIKKIGLYRNKSRFIFESGKKINSEFNGLVPDNIKELQTLPGVGIKTAKVVMAVLYNGPYLAVDTHVHRVLNRLGFVHTKSREQTDKKAEILFSDSDKSRLHHLLIFFGRYHCTSRNPKCETCPFTNICKYYKTNIMK